MRFSFVRSFAAQAAKRKGGVQGGARDSAKMGRPQEEMPQDKTTLMAIELLRPVEPPPKRSEAERQHLRKLMIRYGKLKRRHFLEQQLKKNKFALAKWAALDALPNSRRIEVVSQEAEPFPLNRPIFTHTPPIPGFNLGNLTRKSNA